MEITEECWHRNNPESHIAVISAFDTCVAEWELSEKKNKNAEEEISFLLTN